MLASTIQFTNTPRPTEHPRPRQTPATHTSRCANQHPNRPRQQPPPHHPHPPPTRETGKRRPEERGLFPQDPTARRHPHPARARAAHQDHTGRRPPDPGKPGPASTHTKERGVVCGVSTHERSVTTRTVVSRL